MKPPPQIATKQKAEAPGLTFSSGENREATGAFSFLPSHPLSPNRGWRGASLDAYCERETLLGRGVLRSGWWSLRCRRGHGKRHQGLSGWGCRCCRCCGGSSQVQVTIVHGHPLLKLSHWESRGGGGGRSSWFLSLQGVPDGASWMSGQTGCESRRAH